MVDFGNIARRVVSYDIFIILYWVNMNLISHSSLSTATKWEGDEELVSVWKDHNIDLRLMHRKIDIMATNMGIELFHPRMEKA